MSLKTDYKDDILAYGNLRKYQMIQNNDGTVSFQDVTQYEQTGDVFGAGDINRTNQAVNEKFDSGDVVDPMLTTEPGFAADAYQTKLQFDAQNKNFKWKLCGESVGKTNVTLPTTYEEILVIATRSDGNVSVTLNVPYIALFDDSKGFHVGTYGNDGYFTMAVYTISKTQINLHEFKNNGNDQTTSAKTRVYYR